MVVEANVVAVDEAGQGGSLDRRCVDHDRRIVGPVDPGEHLIELVVAVDEDRFHGRPAAPEYDMAKPYEMEGGMPGEFQGKVVVVSGGSRGIGRGIALAFAREGAQTVLASSSADNLAVGGQGRSPRPGRSRSRSPATCASLRTASSCSPA